VGGQLYYGARDENGATGFTGTLDFEQSLDLEVVRPPGEPLVFRYAIDAGPFVDVSAELTGVDQLDSTSLANGWTLEAGFLLPEPSPAMLLACAAAGLAVAQGLCAARSRSGPARLAPSSTADSGTSSTAWTPADRRR
jgi:hypothetical protein